MPRPFPFPINIGTDICSIPRIIALLTRKPSNAVPFINRLLTVSEREHIPKAKNVLPPLQDYWGKLAELEKLETRWVESGNAEKNERRRRRRGESRIMGAAERAKGLNYGVLRSSGRNEKSLEKGWSETVKERWTVDVRRTEGLGHYMPTLDSWEADLSSNTPSTIPQDSSDSATGAAAVPSLDTPEAENDDTKSQTALSATNTKTTRKISDLTGTAQRFLRTFGKLRARRRSSAETSKQSVGEKLTVAPRNQAGAKDGVTGNRAGETDYISPAPDITDTEEASSSNTRADGKDTTPDIGAAFRINEEDQDNSNRILNEKAKLLSEINILTTHIKNGSQWLAGRFAAKEAAIKAHRDRRLTFHDIRIINHNEKGHSIAPEAHIISEDFSWDDAQIVPMNISHDEAYATAVCLSCENEEPAKPAIPTVEHSSDSADAKAPILGKSLVEPPVRMAETELIRKRTSVKPPARLSETKSIWKRTSLKPLIRTTESDRPVVRKVIADFMTSIEGPPKVKLVPVPGLLNEVKANHQQEIFDGRKESDEDGISSPALIDEQEIEPQKLQEQSETEPMPITQNSAWQEGSPIGEPDNKPTQPSQDETSDLATAELSERARRTIFLGNLPPTATIADLENLFTGLSASVKAYLYTDRSGTLLGTGAVVLSSSTDATAARLARDNAELQGRKIRCMPWFSTSYRRFLQRVITRDAVWLKPGLRSNTEDKPSLEPRAILEPPLPQPSSTQYMLVEEMFRIQDEYQQRRARGVLVTNLDGDVSEADLLELFGAYSASVTAQMRTGPGEERGARSAFVTFANAADATKAKEEVDGTMWGGMEIRVKSIGNREKDEFWGGRGKTLVRDRGV